VTQAAERLFLWVPPTKKTASLLSNLGINLSQPKLKDRRSLKIKIYSCFHLSVYNKTTIIHN